MASADDYLHLIWNENAFLVRDEPFTLKSGVKSHVYANHRALICSPEHLRFLAKALVAAATNLFGTDLAFCAVDSSTSPYLVSSCSLESGLPLINYRPVNREKGLPDVIFSPPKIESGNERPHVCLVDDVVTTSATLDNAAMDLEFAGWPVAGAVCLLDRRARPADDDMKIHGLANLKAALTYGLDRDLVAAELRGHAESELGLR